MKCDLHCHTLYSFDSWVKPEKMIEAAIKKGIDCLAITDHNEIKGALEAIEYAKGKPILIIPGIEVKTKEGDILGLNVKEIIPNGLSAKETIKKIKEAGGIAIIPHPFGWACSFKKNLADIVAEIDGIEALNASLFGKGNKKALDFCKKYNLPFTAGSDAHSPNFIGKCYLEIAGKNLSIGEVINQIKNKNAKIGGKEANFFEKLIDRTRRNLAKISKILKKIKFNF